MTELNGGKRIWLHKQPVPDNLKPCEAEVTLWRAVIDQLITDFITESAEPVPKKRARIWLRGNTADFNAVAELAGYTPEQLKKFIAFNVKDVDKLYD